MTVHFCFLTFYELNKIEQSIRDIEILPKLDQSIEIGVDIESGLTGQNLLRAYEDILLARNVLFNLSDLGIVPCGNQLPDLPQITLQIIIPVLNTTRQKIFYCSFALEDKNTERIQCDLVRRLCEERGDRYLKGRGVLDLITSKNIEVACIMHKSGFNLLKQS